MKLVFDLDYTLLDTAGFKTALKGAVAVYGPSGPAYDEAYASILKREGKVYDYDPDAHLDALGLKGKERARARAGIDDVLRETEKYLYPGAKELIEALGRHGEATLELMTLGNEKWQRAKVEHSGLMKMFDKVICTEKDKKGIIRGLGDGEGKVIIINDNGEEMAEMMAEAPGYAYILKKGPKPAPDDLLLPTAESIEALAALLERETGWELRREMREISEARPAP